MLELLRYDLPSILFLKLVRNQRASNKWENKLDEKYEQNEIDVVTCWRPYSALVVSRVVNRVGVHNEDHFCQVTIVLCVYIADGVGITQLKCFGADKRVQNKKRPIKWK